MSKRKRLHQKIAEGLVSIFVLAVFIVPLFMTAKWAGSFFIDNDPRKVQPAVTFQAREIDKTNQTLKPFEEPIVTIAFDDGWESVYIHAFPVMQSHGIYSTQFIITNTFNDPAYMSIKQIRSMKQAGHEIASHTVSHPDLTKLSHDQLVDELKNSREALVKEFGPIRDFTTPLGALNAATIKEVAKYYRSQKNAEGYISADGLGAINIKKGFNPLNYKSYSVRKSTSLEDIEKLLIANQKNKGWLILTYHQVDDSGAEYSVTPAVFREHMRMVSTSRNRSATVGRVFDILLPNWKAEQ